VTFRALIWWCSSSRWKLEDLTRIVRIEWSLLVVEMNFPF